MKCNEATQGYCANADQDGNCYNVDCEAYREDTVKQEQEANARLIAAAPDLLAACKMMRDAKYPWQMAKADEAMAIAIAKAEGKDA